LGRAQSDDRVVRLQAILSQIEFGGNSPSPCVSCFSAAEHLALANDRSAAPEAGAGATLPPLPGPTIPKEAKAP